MRSRIASERVTYPFCSMSRSNCASRSASSEIPMRSIMVPPGRRPAGGGGAAVTPRRGRGSGRAAAAVPVGVEVGQAARRPGAARSLTSARGRAVEEHAGRGRGPGGWRAPPSSSATDRLWVEAMTVTPGRPARKLDQPRRRRPDRGWRSARRAAAPSGRWPAAPPAPPASSRRRRARRAAGRGSRLTLERRAQRATRAVHVRQAELARPEGDLVGHRRVEEHGVHVLEEERHLAAEAAAEGRLVEPPRRAARSPS